MVWKDAGAIFQRRFHWRRRCRIVRSLSTRYWHIKDVYMRQKKKDIYVLCEVTQLPRTYTYVLRQMKSPKVWSFELPWTNKLRSLRKVAGSGVYLALLRRFLWCANFEQLPFYLVRIDDITITWAISQTHLQVHRSPYKKFPFTTWFLSWKICRRRHFTLTKVLWPHPRATSPCGGLYWKLLLMPVKRMYEPFLLEYLSISYVIYSLIYVLFTSLFILFV